MFNLHNIFKVLGIIFIALSINACFVTNKIYSENDVVYSTKRFELQYYAGKPWDRRSPLYYLEQFIVKEINSENEVSYNIYDILHLSGSSFELDEKVIYIIDNEPFHMIIDEIELDNSRRISEDRKDILRSDSVNVSVITGYSVSNSKIIKFTYKLPDLIIDKIRQSKSFSIRYYSGPSMITVTPKRKSIVKIKKLIDIS